MKLNVKHAYELARIVLTQAALVRLMLNIKGIDGTSAKTQGKDPSNVLGSEFEYWCWRYVYMKDVTKTCLTNKFLKMGFDNLTVIEIMDMLGQCRRMVLEVVKQSI